MNNILLINFLAYLSWAVFSYKRNGGKIDAHLLMVIFYTFLAFMGYYTVETGIYQNTFGTVNVKSLELTPYILCFVSYAILIYPLKKLSKVDVSNCEWIFEKRVSVFITLWVIIAVSLTILKFSEAIVSISTGLGDAYESRHIEGETLFTYDNFLVDQLNGKGPFIMEATTPIIVFYSIVGLSRKLIKPFKAYSLICLCFLWSFFANLGGGSRGGIFMLFFCILFFIFIFYDFFSKKQLKQIFYCGTCILMIFVFYTWIITTERVGKSEGLESIFRYFGESFPNLGFSFWNKVTYNPMGERLFPSGAFEKTFESVDDFYRYWWSKTDVPVLNFKTYFGDLYIEFGTIGAIAFNFFLSAIVYRFIFIKGTTIEYLPFIYYYFQLCVFSFAGFTKGGHHAAFQLMIIIILFLGIKIVKKKRLNNLIER